MSSILDAVTRDASRSGSIPPGASPGSGGGGGPSRFRSAALVVAFGVAVGALAARNFGGGEPPADDLLTEKVAERAATEKPAAPAVENADSVEIDKNAQARKKEADTRVAAAGAAPAAPLPSPPALVIPAPASIARPAPPVAALPATPPAAAPPAAPPAAAPPASAPTIVAAQPLLAKPSPPPAVATAPAIVIPPAVEEQPAAALAEVAPPDAVLEGRPMGAPEISILFVAWSRTPAKRMASMRVGQGSLSVVHEGEYVEGLQVSAIHPEAVDFAWTGQKFRVPVREF